MRTNLLKLIATALASASISTASLAENKVLLNVSYDLSRELYKDFNQAFVQHWKSKTGEQLTINQSHGGSTRQAQSVANGLEADVVTMNQATDLDFLASKDVVAQDWRKRFPHDASPYSTTTVFIVRKGNPKGIRDWDDLTRSGVSVVIPNPKTSGNGRYTYLAAWGHALQTKGGEGGAREFVKNLFSNVPVFDGGGRGATTTFAMREIGDVLVTFENEVELLEGEFGAGRFQVVYPSLSVDASAPVAVALPYAQKKNNETLAKAYLDFLFTLEGQRIVAKHRFRPRLEAVRREFVGTFPAVKTFKVEELIGPWETVQKAHFAEGGIYDQISQRGK